MLIAALREDLCLAYANTLFWRGRDKPTETLHDFSDLLRWLEDTAGVSATDLGSIAQWSRAHPGKRPCLRRRCRVCARRCIGASPRRPPPSARAQQDFAAPAACAAQAPARSGSPPAAGGYAWKIERLQPSAPHLLAPILWSAGDLLIKGARGNVRRCANAECLWLFIDASKNATRRWCDMASCGNRAKARRHYLKVKDARSPRQPAFGHCRTAAAARTCRTAAPSGPRPDSCRATAPACRSSCGHGRRRLQGRRLWP